MVVWMFVSLLQIPILRVGPLFLIDHPIIRRQQARGKWTCQFLHKYQDHGRLQELRLGHRQPLQGFFGHLLMAAWKVSESTALIPRRRY